jgi:hypothetical protein
MAAMGVMSLAFNTAWSMGSDMVILQWWSMENVGVEPAG